MDMANTTDLDNGISKSIKNFVMLQGIQSELIKFNYPTCLSIQYAPTY